MKTPQKLLGIGVSLVFGIAVVPALISSFSNDPCPLRSSDSSDDAKLFPARSALQDMGKAFAVAQWSRKYKTSCKTCHTVFPRLNYYGERFKWNGYQSIEAAESDGDTEGKKTYGDTDIGQVQDWFGARINMRAFQYDTHSLTTTDSNGEKLSKMSLGDAGSNWLQFFTAGSIIKDVSFFDELELSPSGTLKHGWFTVGFHNLWGPRGLVNLRVGQLSPKDWTAFSNRLRIFPEYTAATDKTTFSAGAGDEKIATSDKTAGIDYYGHAGPFLWALGVGNPSYAGNTNRYLNYWGSIRADMTDEESDFEGSNLSLFYYTGTDTKDTAAKTEKSNHYTSFEPALNIRYGGWDMIFSYLMNKESNFGLKAEGEDKEEWQGFAGIVSWTPTTWMQPGVELDKVYYKNNPSKEASVFVARVAFQPRDNFNIILNSKFNVHGSDPKSKSNQYTVTFRSMF